MANRFSSREDRHVARLHRAFKAAMLLYLPGGPKYAQAKASYERWEQTPEYQEDMENLKRIIAETEEEARLTGIDPNE